MSKSQKKYQDKDTILKTKKLMQNNENNKRKKKTPQRKHISPTCHGAMYYMILVSLKRSQINGARHKKPKRMEVSKQMHDHKE